LQDIPRNRQGEEGSRIVPRNIHDITLQPPRHGAVLCCSSSTHHTITPHHATPYHTTQQHTPLPRKKKHGLPTDRAVHSLPYCYSTTAKVPCRPVPRLDVTPETPPILVVSHPSTNLLALFLTRVLSECRRVKTRLFNSFLAA
jgi:hypothetical protein